MRVLVRVMGNVYISNPQDQCLFVEYGGPNASKESRDAYLSELAAAGLLAKKNLSSTSSSGALSHLTTIHLMDPTLVKASFDRSFNVHEYVDRTVTNEGLFLGKSQALDG